MIDHREMCRRAAVDGFEQLCANPIRAALVYRPGEIRLIPADAPTPSGFTFVQGSSQIPWRALTCDQIAMRIHDLTRSLPVLDSGDGPPSRAAA